MYTHVNEYSSILKTKRQNTTCLCEAGFEKEQRKSLHKQLLRKCNVNNKLGSKNDSI